MQGTIDEFIIRALNKKKSMSAQVLGEENIIDYDACRVSGGACVTPPVCPGNGCYCAEIAMASYIIIYY